MRDRIVIGIDNHKNHPVFKFMIKASKKSPYDFYIATKTSIKATIDVPISFRKASKMLVDYCSSTVGGTISFCIEDINYNN